MINSKKGGFMWIIVLIIVALVFAYAIISLSPLVGKAGGEIFDFFPDEEADLGGTKASGSFCASSWSCMENLACVGGECKLSETIPLKVRGKANCRNDYNGFWTNGVVAGEDCASYPAGTYQLEISSEESGRIRKSDSLTSQNVFIYAENAAGAFALENCGFPTRTDKDIADGKYMYPMTINKIYTLCEELTLDEFRLCAWTKDEHCDDNSGFVTIRVDKIVEDEEETAGQIGTL